MSDAETYADPAATYVEPFSAMYAKISTQRRVLVLLAASVAALAVCVVALALRAPAMVYAVSEAGEARFLGDVEAHSAPRPEEARKVASQFVELAYRQTSDTVEQDLAAALAMCTESLGDQWRAQAKESGHIRLIRRAGVRSRVQIDEAELLVESKRHREVRVQGRVFIYESGRYDAKPRETREFDVLVVLQVTERIPGIRDNGLLVESILKPDVPRSKGTSSGRK